MYECPQGHICFSKDSLYICGMKGCGKTTLVLSPIDIKWFYKINKTGLCINSAQQNSRLSIEIAPIYFLSSTTTELTSSVPTFCTACESPSSHTV